MKLLPSGFAAVFLFATAAVCAPPSTPPVSGDAVVAPQKMPQPTAEPAPAAATTLYSSVRSFGATGDGIADDTPAFTRAAEDALKNGRTLFIPSGDYKLTGRIVCHRWTKEFGRGSLTVLGENVRFTRLHFYPQAANDVLFEHTEWFVVKNLTVTAEVPDDQPHRGIAFSTPLNAQSAYSSYENIQISGRFKYAWFNRFTMHDQWRNVSSKGPLCHFMFAHSASHDTPLGPSKTGWNSGSEGWFHNLGTLDGVVCNGGEVGVAGAVMQFNFVQFTAQGQTTGGGAGNRILPKGDPGTGIYLVGRDNTAGGALRGNTIGAYYTEVTERPLYARNGGVIRGSSAFFQGRAASPFPAAIVLDNTRLVFGTVTVRMPFTNLFAGENKASCGVELLDAPHAKAKTDATSRLKVNTAMGE